MKMIKCISNLVLLIIITGCQSMTVADTDAMVDSLAGTHRSDANKARDQYRHPQQTLTFFGVTENMTVVEVWPGGGGWYTEILAPLLRDKGKLYAAHFDPDSKVAYFKKNYAKFQEKLKNHPQIYDQIAVTVLQPPGQVDIAPKGSADRVLTFRNVHNWIKAGQADAVFAAMFSALKAGGVLGVVEHRAAADGKQDEQAISGYVSEATVMALAEKAGFKLAEKSEINANTKDSHDHPEGVWTLPPTLRLQDTDRDKYLAIGESDRMTLKFVKP